jgi:hydroxypyruvate reductase
VTAALDAADAGHLVQQSLASPDIVASLHRALSVDVLAVGKAAGPMLEAFTATSPVPTRHTLSIGIHDAGHPLPDERSVAAANQALHMAAATTERDLLVVLLSGGASALMALPSDGLELADKQATVRRLLEAGADITEVNTVRKHLSRIKGGRLAAASAGPVLTLAVSDVVGDNLSVIGSGPTVADPSTWNDALAVLDRRGGRRTFPAAAVAVLERGDRGELAETPKPGDTRLARSRAIVIGGRKEALAGARHAARALGFHVHVLTEPVVGEARDAARAYAEAIRQLRPSLRRPACVLSAGETTVTVRGRGRGGRNQEFALALVKPMAAMSPHVAAASVGTDGVDGPTDAAGALVDHTTLARSASAGVDADISLDNNDSYPFFLALNDLIQPGPTDTNVGDLQVFLIDE